MSGIELNHSRPTKKIFHRPQSFRDIQGWISKMNPELVKTVIESGKKPLYPAHYPPTVSLRYRYIYIYFFIFLILLYKLKLF
ncbi:hypothetical protein HanHA300_Chr08g0264391 [Helianthus annuus]|nr:hypothetical protein HanHA300_Chr08g0264391 [Helianthus annuus]KAJ0717816.1 hypothetical protein HanLR1_Chr08g0263361 [Helianthus annuus]